MAENEVRTSNRRLNSGSSAFNAISFVIESQIKGMVNTCIPVRVDSCTAPGTGGAAGYVSCTPLVTQMGADGKTLAPVSLPQLPFFRLQCGTAAIVADPQPGDIGLAVFAQQDCSTVNQGASEPAQPGSFRCFDMADGFYLGGFLNMPPTTYIELDPQSGNINIKAPASVTVNAQSVTVTAPTITMTGTVKVNGTLTSTGNMTAGSISMQGHRHSGVESGNDQTGVPVA